MTLPLLIPIRKSREMLGWSRTRTYELIAHGHLEMVKVGRESFVTRRSAERFIENLPVVDVSPLRDVPDHSEPAA